MGMLRIRHTTKKKEEAMVKVLDYIIKVDAVGFMVYHKDRVQVDKRSGTVRAVNPLYTGNITDALKLVLRESIHDWMEETKDEELTVRDLLEKINELDWKIWEISKGA